MKDSEKIQKILRKCCEALDGKKAESITLLDLREQSTITDFMIVATGTSEPHLRALRRTVEEVIEEEDFKILGSDYQPLSGWLVVDGFHFMIHVFSEEKRELYQMESLWQSGIQVDWTKDL